MKRKNAYAAMIAALVLSAVVVGCGAENGGSEDAGETSGGGDVINGTETVAESTDEEDIGMDNDLHVNYERENQGNPFLSLWEYVPDGEPYVFEDPDEPGKYRVYIYGSHDTYRDSYCGDDLVLWSAPVDDLSDWRYDGVIFKSVVDGKADTLFAPDVALVTAEDGTKTYYLYPNNQSWGRGGMVARSSRPDGPFEVCNWKNGSSTETEGFLGFDPAVFVDDDGQVYAYWGFQHSRWAKVDPATMATMLPGETEHRNIPSYDSQSADDYDPARYNIVNDENAGRWGFFEASSLRRVGNKYVFIFSRNGQHDEPTGKNYNQLAYGYSDSPAGPWKWGGIIVDAQGETIPSSGGGYHRSFNGGNTHGSICEINGRWYVFYHRNVETFARQAMVEPITVEWDERPVAEGGEVRISTAEVTSSGFYADGIDPYKKVSAGRACYIRYGGRIEPRYGKDVDSLPITELKNGSVVGFKYFNFDVDAPDGNIALMLEIAAKGVRGSIDVYMRPPTAVNTRVEHDGDGIVSVGEGSRLLCSVEIDGGAADADSPTTLRVETPDIAEYDGKWGLFFVFNCETDAPLCDFYSFRFSVG